MILRKSIFVLALLSGAVSAQNSLPSNATLNQTVAQNEGMSLVSNGLYYKKDEFGESFVAVNEAGQQSLLTRLIDIRAHSAGQSNALPTSTAVDKLIDAINQPQPKDQVGDCNGPASSGYLSALASSAGGTFAGATASNTNAAYYTTNVVGVDFTNGEGDDTGSQSSTQYGTTPATISANAPRGGGGIARSPCTANAYATVTCPGATHPSISAFAHSQHGSCLL